MRHVRFLATLGLAVPVALLAGGCSRTLDTTDSRTDDPIGGVAQPLETPVCYGGHPQPTGFWAGADNADDVYGALNGTLGSGVTFASGKVGQAFVFNGANDIKIPDSPSLTFPTTLTVEAWINPTNVNPLQIIVSKNRANGGTGYNFGISGGKLGFGFNNGTNFTLSSTTTLPANTWTHVAATRNANVVKLYINGVLDATSTSAPNSALGDSTLPLTIGSENTVSGRFFTGLIDEPAVWGAELTAAQIAGIYDAGTAGKCHCAPNLCATGTICSQTPSSYTCRAPVLDFQTHQDFPAGTRPFGVAVGDVNNDGKPDVAFTLITSDLVSVQLGNGDGTFGAASTFAVGSNPKFVEIADFNGDGNADLAVSGGTVATHYVSILLGNGDGTFQGRANYNVNSFDPSGAAVADFNGDGKLDIATANFVGSTVSILLGNGDGTFQSAVTYLMLGTPNSVAAADLNGDGKLDLVTGNYNGRNVGVLLGNGDGTFQPAVTIIISLGGRFVQAAAVGDLNGDGKPDVAASLFNDKLVSVLIGNGDGTFQSAIDYPVANGAGDLKIADFNGDGRADIAGTLYGSNAVGVLLGNGDGTLQSASNFAVGTGPFYMAVGDLNGDGKRDIVTANYTGGSGSVLLNASH
ncbi:FG-GAP-like repeat-containing protein [Cystobacter fuscus]|uniref:FG-GAP-like repeat-containing protein n=1 Tax=Cystobacter fuscus TaxID=43 RepID=UPI002B290DAE|nr:hypothetical protein F0U63_30630 [Cystobacter fuscus]